MCCVALGFHVHNKLVKPHGIWWIVVPAVIAAVGGALCGNAADNKVLRVCFAIFLIGVGVWQLIVAIKFIVANKKQNNLPTVFQSSLPSNILSNDKQTKDK